MESSPQQPASPGIAPDRPLTTIVNMIERAGDLFGDREAFRSLGSSLSYRELLVQAGSVTSWLQQTGLRKGDRVAIMMPNLLPYPVCLYGALLGGYVVVSVNPLYTARELAFQLTDSGARALFVLEPFAQVAAQALKDVPVPHVVVVATGDLLGAKGYVVNFVTRHLKRTVPAWNIPSHVPFPQVLRAGRTRLRAPVSVGEDDIAFLQYTGGTTGVAKGAVILHRNVIAHTMQLTGLLEPALGRDPDGIRVLTALPMYHAAAMLTQVLVVPPYGGCCILIANPRDLDGLVKALARERFTSMGGVNTLYRALLDHPKIGTVDFTRCRLFGAGAMATQKTVSDRWQALTGRRLIEGYGMTETAGLCTCNPIDLESFNGSVGVATPGTEISIRDERGNVVPAGEPGEICVRGPQVMAGYWNRPDETAKAMTADGFLRTGDGGSVDENGFVRLHDRIKDMIVVSGFNVYPNEVEAVLAAHPQIVEAAVVGIEDPHSGEAVAASIVRRDPALTEEAVIEHCRQNLTAYKCPKRIAFVGELPKSVVGKILRRAVRDQWKASAAVKQCRA
jgi:long-chain acyl-CoA synthetase